MGPGRPGAPRGVDVEDNGLQLLAGDGEGLHEQRPGGQAMCLGAKVEGAGQRERLG